MTNIATASAISNSTCRVMTGSGVTMVRIVTIPVVSIPTAAAKTVRPCGSVNSV